MPTLDEIKERNREIGKLFYKLDDIEKFIEKYEGTIDYVVTDMEDEPQIGDTVMVNITNVSEGRTTGSSTFYGVIGEIKLRDQCYQATVFFEERDLFLPVAEQSYWNDDTGDPTITWSESEGIWSY